VANTANTAQAKKRARQAEDHRQHNAGLKSRFRTAVKDVVKAVQAKQKDAAVAAYKQAVPVIDSMVNKKLVHQKKAARHKSRLNAHIKALG
jgi:small subunit ribosomal protein S20